MVFFSLQNFSTMYLEEQASEYKFPPLKLIFSSIIQKIMPYSNNISHFINANGIKTHDFIQKPWSQLFIKDRSLEDSQSLILNIIISRDPMYFMILFIASTIAELDNRISECFPEQPDLLYQLISTEIRSINFKLLFYNVDRLRIFFDTYKAQEKQDI